MAASRFATLLLVLPLLAACDSEQQPPADTPPAAAEADAVIETGPTDLAPLFGTFARDLSWCSGDGEGFPVTVSADSFAGYENSCDMLALTDNGDGSFNAELRCAAEGQTVEESLKLVPIFAPSGEGINITYLDRGDDVTTLLRCD